MGHSNLVTWSKKVFSFFTIQIFIIVSESEKKRMMDVCVIFCQESEGRVESGRSYFLYILRGKIVKTERNK